MIKTTIYNEQTRLLASLVNLMGVGFITAGFTTPLVSAFYGIQLWSSASPALLVFGGLLWFSAGLMSHLAAWAILRSLIE